MAEEFRNIRENLFKIFNGLGVNFVEPREEDDGGMDAGTARALISAVFARAGKSKDEVVQIVAREIGMAVAAMLKEPLALLAKNQKLQISFEFVPKDHVPEEAPRAAAPRKPRKKARPAKKAARKKTSRAAHQKRTEAGR